MLLNLGQGILPGTSAPTASAHNLQTRMVYMFFDPETQACLDARLGGTPLPPGCPPLPPGWQPGDPVLQAGDELGVIIKVVPRDGTTTGVGGHIDFYIPNGVQVVDVAYVVPNGAGGFDKVAMKGQSPIAIGAGPIGAKTTAQLVGLTDVYTSAASGLSSTAVNPTTGLHLGTIAGVYGDTGIFYSTDPDTAYGSWQTYNGASTANGCGSLAFNPTALGPTLVNNSGDTVVPCNKWDAEQLLAWGVKGGTFGQSAPIVDYGDGRGNAPWGFASGVAGPESGYAWHFDWDEWQASGKTAADMRNAMGNDEIGPWRRIQYNGDRVSYDQPGLISSVLGYANIDAGNLGVPVSTLPTTVSQTDTTSPKAIRWAVGQLTAYRPEYAWAKIRVTDATAGITNPAGCANLRGDTFGGDAGGTDNGKDHLWRYYEPTEVKVSMCAAVGKPATKELVKSGTVFQYPIKIYNLQAFPLTNVVVKDALGSGLTFLGAVPAQNSGPNPLTWNVGTLLPGQKFEAVVSVKATSTGFLDNCVVMQSDQLTESSCDTTISGLYPYLVPGKTARSSSVAPGGTVIYDLLVRNIGEGPTGNPVTISEFLPTGFSYDPSYAPVVYVNGALVTLLPSQINYTNPNNPIFTVPAAIQGGKQLTLAFRATVSPATQPGLACNTFSATQNGVPITSGSEACVQVAGGKIGDTVWRDWDGDGVQDPGEEGIAGVTVKLYDATGTNLLATTTTDANGNYYFPGLTAGTYVVEVNNGAALPNTVQTGDPDATLDNRHTVTLATDQQYLSADFGYRPTGTGVIGDKVFEDIGNDGSFDAGTDFGIPNVTVWLYEDSNSNGVIDVGDALVATRQSNATGDYSFTGLATGYSYLVKVDKNDPDIQSYFNNKYDPDPVPYQLSTVEIKPSPNLTGSDLDNDFGFWRVEPGSIGDQVFIDNNGNGVYDTGDTPIAGVTVTLYRDGQPFATTVSGPDGTYLFDNLGPGNYTVEVDTGDPDIPGGLFATVSRYDKALAAGENYLTADFPFVPLISKTVDKVYATTGQTLTFGVNVNYPGNELLSDVTVRDFIPAGTTYASAGQGGSLTTFSSAPGVPGLNPGSGGYAVEVFEFSNVTTPEEALDAPDDVTAELRAQTGNYLTLDMGQTIPNGSVLTLRLRYRLAGGSAIPVADVDGSTDGSTFSGLATISGLTTSLADYSYTVSHTSGGIRYLRIRARAPSGNAADQYVQVDSVAFPASASDPATENSISASPTVIALGSSVTVTMTVKASAAVNNVTPSALQVIGGSATVSGPSPSSRNLAANTQATFTWTVTPSKVGEFIFSASATGASGIEFVEARSNSILVSPEGQNQYVAWNLGSNDPGTFGITAANKYIYAFGGNDTLAFWAYNTATGAWNNPLNPADTPAGVTIKEGGALANDGSRYIYALRGDQTRVFLRYDTQTDTWNDAGIADLPGTTNKVVGMGGALIYLNGYVYAFLGNDSQQFWRYDVAGNSWTQMASTPTGGTVNQGGSLATDGTNIYALQGDGKKGFWRYNVGSNTWTVLQPITENVGKGGALRYANGAFYALIGNKTQRFYRYNIAANTWTRLADTGTNIQEGGALAFDGVYLYAFMGNSTGYKRYDLSANTWTALTAAPATVKWGGALTFLATGNVSRTSASASKSLVTGVSQVTLRMTVTSDNAINNITANAPTYTATGGATAAFSGATLVSPDDDISGPGDPVIYRWTATVTPGSVPGEIVFTLSNSLGASSAAKTNSVLVTPALTWSATVNSNPPAVIYNTALLNETGGTIPNVPSNTTETATAGSIGDRVWADLNGNGVQDVGEFGLPGVKVYVDSNNNGQWDAGEPYDLTDASGLYRIYNMGAGTYTVRPDPATYPAGYLPTTASSLSVSLSAGQQYNDADFGLKPAGTGSIGDMVWLDANNNGVLDAGESGLPGITVTLQKCVGAVCTPVATKVTDANGQYQFTGLVAGDYRVVVDSTSVVTSPYGGTFSLAAAMAPTYDKDGIATPHTTLVTLATDSTVVSDADFGYNWSGKIGDYVWWDNNANGLQDESPATPIANAAVLLYFDANGNGVLDPAMGDYQVGFAMTGPNGAYLFSNLPPGPYFVDVYEDSITTDGNRNIVPTTGNVLYKNLGAGETYLDADFGYYRGALVQGSVFHDDDRNSLFEGSENGLAGIEVCLYASDGVTVIACKDTDADGYFVFIVPEGDYVLKYNTGETTAAGYPDATTPISYSFHAYPGENWYEHTFFDFGVDYSGAVGDRVWNDADADGVQDAGETGLADVTVSLYRDTDNSGTLSAGDGFVAAQATDAAGQYLFIGLADGAYVVVVNPATLPADFGQTADPDQPGIPCTSCDNQGAATISGGGSVLTVDFGYKYSPPVAVSLYNLNGTVWHDVNGDGQFISESGIPTVTVQVTYVYTPTSGSATTVTVQTTTAGNGAYAVNGIPEGAVVTVRVVTATLPNAAYVQTGDPDQPGVPCTVCDSQTRFTMPAGDVTDKNFGYQQVFGGIGGTVVIGPNANGIADVGETPLAGVTITLIYAGADGILGTADDTTTGQQTNASGQYSFTNLLPGLYQVIETNLPGYLSVADRDGGNPDNITVNLALGQHVEGRDFEDVPPPAAAVSKVLSAPVGRPIAVGDTVTFTIRITNTGITPLASLTISDTYDAGKLTPLGFSVPPNSQAAGLILWTTNLSPSLPLAAGASLDLMVAFRADAVTLPDVTTNNVTVTGQDVFEQPLGPLTAQASVQIEPAGSAQIGDRVWWDINGNGVQDVGEPGLANVDVLLNGGAQSTTTNASGEYLFTWLPADTYTVTISPTEFQPGGTLYNWYGTAPTNLIHTVAVTQTQVVLTADFGLNIPSSYAVSKQLAMADPTRPGEPITFTIRVTNTGATWLARLSLQDTYNNTFMTYGFGGDFAQPDSDDHVNDGVINWTDALSTARGGPGLLAPGASTVITVWFTAREDTLTEGSLGTANRITVTAALFDPDGTGPLEALASQPAQGATAYVRIYRPTGITVTDFRAVAGTDQVTLNWRTANEAQILGFNVLRRVGGSRLQSINEEIIAAEYAGSNQGTTYTFTDPAAPAGIYVYVLETIHLDGRSIQSSPIIVRVTQ